MNAMRQHIKTAAIVLMAILSLSACRKESDMVQNYSYESVLAFGGADKSFGEKFKILWEGLNTNYALWDFEAEHGLDWDEVYETYYPKFVELDTLSLKRTITNKELENLLNQVVGPLHDGHLSVEMKNHSNDSTAYASPGNLRIESERKQEIKDLEKFKAPSLAYYEQKGIAKDVRTFDATTDAQLAASRDSAKRWIKAALDTLSAKTVLTDSELDTQNLVQDIERQLADLEKILSNRELLAAFNKIANRYAYLNIPGFYVLDESLFESGLRMTSALLNGNIAYLNFSDFSITEYLTRFTDEAKDMEPYAASLVAGIKETWEAWFNTIQDLHKSGKLGGVIIDVRCNSGGSTADYQYVLGALVPSGGLQIMNSRCKRGTGRYDYSPVTPSIMPTYQTEHVTVTEPIVVLANAKSVSMAELTSIGTKVLDNARLVGTRTWGGLCGLVDNQYYDLTYAGHIGVSGKTPVYVYCPITAMFDMDGHILEGYGVTPDIEVPLDLKAWNMGAGPDSQLDRAIEYIVTGK